MPLVHLYLNDGLYRLWAEEFPLKGKASNWFQGQFEHYLKTKTSLTKIKEELIEKKNLVEKTKFEIEQTEQLIRDLEKIEEKKKIAENDEKILISEIEPRQLINLTKVMIETYEIVDNAIARKLAIEYLSIKSRERPPLEDFMKKKRIENTKNV